MAVSIMKIPDVGEGVAEVELTEWLVKPGDTVREDDPIAAVMTDKATVEIPSLFAGKIVSLGGEIGQTLAVGSVLVTIEHAGEGRQAAPVHKEEAKAAEPAPEPAKPPSAVPAQVAQSKPEVAVQVAATASAPGSEGQVPLAAPSVRKRARECGIDLRQVRGSGPGGRITDVDLDAAVSAPPQAAGPSRRREGSEQIRVLGLRRKIADKMALANSQIPHITVVEEVDVTTVEELRASLNASRDPKSKLTVLPLITAAVCRALLDHPEMNAHFDDGAGVVTRHRPVHLGIATMTDGGLMVPVLRHAESLGPFATAAEIARLAQAARTGKATRDELTGSTFTISSLGPLGAIATTPIINHPEVAILGVNKIAVRPMWDGSQFVPRKMMNLSASFDHRVIDGWDAARFVQRIKSLLESPALIFLEPEE